MGNGESRFDFSLESEFNEQFKGRIAQVCRSTEREDKTWTKVLAAMVTEMGG